MGMSKNEAIDQIVNILLMEQMIYPADYGLAERLLDFMTDPDNGLGMLPPLTKKGKYEWENSEEEQK